MILFSQTWTNNNTNTIESYSTVYKVLSHLFGVGSDFSGWPSSWIESECKLPGQRASSSPNFPQTILKVIMEKWTEYINILNHPKLRICLLKDSSNLSAVKNWTWFCFSKLNLALTIFIAELFRKKYKQNFYQFEYFRKSGVCFTAWDYW